MRFSEVLPTLPIAAYVEQAQGTTPETVRRILAQGGARNVLEFAALISPAAQAFLEPMAALAQQITQRNFGKTIRMFAPLYLSNECINVCTYCGFSRHNPIPRITTPLPQVLDETRMLAAQGFRSLLLVAGEHPKFVSNGYVADVIRQVLPIMPTVGIELGPLEAEDYRGIVEAGAENLICYQESYHPATYASLHPAGPKKHFGFRLDTPERGYDAGFRRVGIGALYGLYNWRFEAIATAAHGLHLLRHCWRAQLSVALPRMRPASGTWRPDPANHMFDRDLVQTILAFRLLLPHAAISLSTREHPALRNGLVRLGVTHMSAGSSTEPGGYSSYNVEDWTQTRDQAGEQFHISDTRSPKVVAAMIRSQGYEPVWKDHDASLAAAG